MISLIEPIKIKQRQKIAQLIVSNIMYPEIELVKFLRSTERNDKGFGEIQFFFIQFIIYLFSTTKTIQGKKFNNTIVTYVTTIKVMTKTIATIVIKPWVFT